jgi:SAM-dependent methyltransferase
MSDSGRSDGDRIREERVREMYSQIRYPGLNPEDNARYVRHRRFIYGRLGLDVEGGFFADKTVLDAGCGTGEETLFLASLGPQKVIGIDTSQGSLQLAREGAERAGFDNVEFRYASVLDESLFPNASFDYISSLGCIHHTPDMPGAFANLCRMVKPGGYLCSFIYNSFGHFLYNLECDLLDRIIGDDVEKRVKMARRLFDWRINKRFRREGISASYDGRLYDKYGVLYRESLTLKELLVWYEREGFGHVGSFPMYLKDIVEALTAREGEERGREGGRSHLAYLLNALLREDRGKREWNWSRRTAMQMLLLGFGLYDYGSAFRILGRKTG